MLVNTMAAPFDTLLLDLLTWDLTVDASGNIAMATTPYSLAQDASSAIRTFRGECFYNTAAGVDYSLILGRSPSLPAMKTAFVDAAKTIPGVASAACFITNIKDRLVTGQVQVVPAQPVGVPIPSPVPFSTGVLLTSDAGIIITSEDGSVLTSG